MPGRYTSDTATHCFSTTYSGMGNRVLMKRHKMRASAATLSGGVTFTDLSGSLTGGTVHADIFFMTTTAAPDAVSFNVSGLSVYGDHITVRIGSASGLHEIAVQETGSGTPLGAYTVTPSVPATTAVVPLSPVPHSTSLTITITALGSTPGALDTITFYLPRDTTVPTNIASNVCTGGGYRYGYNGKLKDNEWAGEGNHYDYGARHYDPRIARWFGRDPMQKKYPNLSPYVYTADNPIVFGDFDGRDFGVIVDHREESKSIVIVATVYTSNEVSKVQAKNAADQWNATKYLVDGYTVTFKVKVAEQPSRSFFSNEQLLIKKNRATATEIDAGNDDLGNAYLGLDGPFSENVFGNEFVGGATNRGKSISMNKHEELGDMGEFSDLVAHEFGHMFGLDDEDGDKDGVIDPYYGGKNGIMEYSGTDLSPISMNDVKMILKYAKDAIAGKTKETDAKVKVVEQKGKSDGSNPLGIIYE